MQAKIHTICKGDGTRSLQSELVFAGAPRVGQRVTPAATAAAASVADAAPASAAAPAAPAAPAAAAAAASAAALAAELFGKRRW